MKIEDIKVGMTLKRARCGSHGRMNVGDTGIVDLVNTDTVRFQGSPAEHDPENLDFVADSKPKQLPIFN
jgi:hypothetical protein